MSTEKINMFGICVCTRNLDGMNGEVGARHVELIANG